MLKGVSVKFSFNSPDRGIQAANTSPFISTALLHQKFNQFRAAGNFSALLVVLNEAGKPNMGFEIYGLYTQAAFPPSFYIEGLQARGQQVIIGLNLLSPEPLEKQFSYARHFDTIHLGKFVPNPYITFPLDDLPPAVIHHAHHVHQPAPRQIRGIVPGNNG